MCQPFCFYFQLIYLFLVRPLQEREPLDPSDEAQKNVPSMLSWAYYQRFFDVDTEQVKERLMWSFIPRPSRDTLSNFIRPSPDLYGTASLYVALHKTRLRYAF